MSSFTGDTKESDRAKAIAAVVAIHVVLVSIIIAGLNVGKVQAVVERLQTFDIREVLPPPPRHKPQPRKASAAAGSPARRAQPSPAVALPSLIPMPSPLPTAKVTGQGNATSSGAASAGSGTGADGNGIGLGAGGTGAEFTPARLVRNIPSSQYQRLASTGMPSGLVGVALLVATDGKPGNCRIARSSGDAKLDALVCQLTLRYVRFNAARDPEGRAVAQDITYFPNWRRR